MNLRKQQQLVLLLLSLLILSIVLQWGPLHDLHNDHPSISIHQLSKSNKHWKDGFDLDAPYDSLQKREIMEKHFKIDKSDSPKRYEDIDPKIEQHWIHQIQKFRIGQYLGGGVASVAFDVELPPSMLSGNSSAKEYVIKFTGDHHRDGSALPKFAEFGEVAVNLTRALAPHPSIPQTLYFQKRMENPFRTGVLKLPIVAKGDKDIITSQDLHKRLLQSNEMSVAIIEKAIATHDHLKNRRLHLSSSKHTMRVWCFWKRLFEILDYVHSHKIRWIDTKLWNVLLQDGEIILFDWHMGNFVHPLPGPLKMDQYSKKKRKKSSHRMERLPELPVGHTYLDDGELVHHHDTYKLGKRIQEFLDMIPEKSRKNNDDDDVRRLHQMRKLMQQNNPPTLGWLLQNDPYFVLSDNSNKSCALTW